MRRKDITAGAEVYYAAGDCWRAIPPTKAVIVDGEPVRIIRGKAGAFRTVAWTPDPAGTALVVDLHEPAGVRRTAVPVRHLRGLWADTLAATGRTDAGVVAHDQAITDLARSGRPVTGEDLLRLAAPEPGLDDGAFAALRRAVDREE